MRILGTLVTGRAVHSHMTPQSQFLGMWIQVDLIAQRLHSEYSYVMCDQRHRRHQRYMTQAVIGDAAEKFSSRCVVELVAEIAEHVLQHLRVPTARHKRA